MRVIRLFVTTATALLGALVLIGTAASAQARTDAPQLFWRWSDGSDAVTRAFAEARYGRPDQLPRLNVATDPVTAGQLVTLQFDDDGTWRTDDRSRTNSSGIAALEFNPFCANGGWCSRTYTYRLIANGVSTSFTIRYAS